MAEQNDRGLSIEDRLAGAFEANTIGMRIDHLVNSRMIEKNGASYILTPKGAFIARSFYIYRRMLGLLWDRQGIKWLKIVSEILKLTIALALAARFFIIHIIISWIFKFAKISLTPIIGNFLSIIIGGALIFIYVLFSLSAKLWVTPLEALACFALVFLTLTGFAYMYFATFAISEVSLHMHIMLMILISNNLSVDAIKIQYNKPHMLKERLKRLIDLGQVREKIIFTI